MARNFVRANSDKLSIATAVMNSSTFTLSLWVNLTSLQAAGIGQAAIYVGNGASNGVGIFAQVGTGGTTHWGGLQGGVSWLTAATTLSLGAWNHLCMFRTAGGNYNLYLNGALDFITGGAIPNTPAALTSIGDDGTGNAGNGQLNGAAADGAIWTAALTVSEVAALANGARPWTVRPGSLVGWWPVDGLQSPEPDLSGLAHNLTVTGTTKTFGPPLTQFTPRWPQGSIFVPPTLTLMPQVCL